MTAGQFSPTDRKILGFLGFMLVAGIVLNLYKQNNRAVSSRFLLSVLQVPSSIFTESKENVNPVFGPLDLNRAGVEELQRLPGIGPALAQRILDYRRKNGAFRTVPQLLRVPGIGSKKLAEIKTQLYVTEAIEGPSAAAVKDGIRPSPIGPESNGLPGRVFLSSETEPK